MARPIVFADLQGTICYSGWRYRESLEGAVKFLHECGGLFVINTTAPPTAEVREVASRLSADLLISLGGEVIEDLREGSTYLNYLTNHQLQHLLNAGGVGELTLKLSQAGERMEVNLSSGSHLGEALHSLSRVEVVGLGGREVRGLERVGLSLHPEGEAVLLRVVPDKGSALRWVCEDLLRLECQEAMAIGDGVADIAALEAVGYPYAMANSSQMLKGVARYHTSRPEQDGVGEAIYDYLYRLLGIKPKEWI